MSNGQIIFYFLIIFVIYFKVNNKIKYFDYLCLNSMDI